MSLPSLVVALPILIAESAFQKSSFCRIFFFFFPVTVTGTDHTCSMCIHCSEFFRIVFVIELPSGKFFIRLATALNQVTEF